MDARSDQFCFCVALYEALHGVRPFAGENAVEVLAAIAERRLSAPAKEAPRWLRPIILRGLEERPEDRWPSMEALLDALSRDPEAARRRRLLWAGGGGAAVTAAVLSVLLLRQSGPAPCEGAAAQAAAVWNPEARGHVRAAFLATSSPAASDVFARVDRLLTRRLDGWAAAHTEACQATRVRGEQSDAMLDLRMQCLQRARRQILSLTDVWRREPVDLEKAIGAAASVGDVAACSDLEALSMPAPPPRDPAVLQRIEAVRGQLDAVAAHRRAGLPTAGLALARQTVASARQIGYAPILSEALYLSGDLECDAGEMDAGLSLMYEAAQAGAEAQDDVLYARILAELLFRLTTVDARGDEAANLSRFAEAAVARAGNRDELMAALLWAQGALLHEQGKFEEALARQRRALSLSEKHLSPEHPDVARLLHGMGNSTRDLGRLEESFELFQRALALKERTLGPDHPGVSASLNPLINLLVLKGDLDQATRVAERALAIRERAYPPHHRHIAQSLHNLGAVRQMQGRLDEARRIYERAETIWLAVVGPDHADTLMTRDNLAALAIYRGDTVSARRLLESVISAEIKIYGEGHPKVGHAWATMGRAFLVEENWGAAADAFTRALAIRRKQEGEASNLWDALEGLGEARIGESRFAEAIAVLEEAKATDERIRGRESPSRDDILSALGQAYLGAGRTATALRLLEEAIAMSEAEPSEAAFLPWRRFHLARALWASGARRRALEIARAARDAMVAPEAARDRRNVEKWLRAHDRRSRTR